MTTHTPTVGLLWHSFRAGNLGVGALSVANAHLVRSAFSDVGPAPEMITIGWDEDRPAYPDSPIDGHVGLHLTDLVPPRGSLHRAIRRCDLIVDIGAGDSFTDIYGRHRFLTQIASKVGVGLARRPLVLAPQTIGPFDHAASRALARPILRRCSSLCTRDAQSTSHVRGLGIERRVVEATDVATSLPFDALDHGDGVHVGVNISGLLLRGGYDGNNMFGLTVDYPSLVLAIVDRLLLDDRVDQVHLVPHVFDDDGSIEDDMSACIQVAADRPSVIVAPRFQGPIQAKSYIAGLDAFIGARMHACIAAISAGVPVLPMAYSRKFNGLFGSLQYPWMMDCRDVDDAAALATFDRFIDERQTAARDARASRELAAAQLRPYIDELRRVATALSRANR